MKQIERLGRLVEDTVRLIKDGGLDPTEALLRTARSGSMTESDVDFVAGQVNKAGHMVHMVKSAGAGRLADFPLADAGEVKSRLDSGLVSPKLSPGAESALGDALKGVVDKKVVVKKAAAAAVAERRAEPTRRLTDAERTRVRIRNDVDLGRELGRANLRCSEAERRLETAMRGDMSSIYGDLGESVASIANRVSKQAAAEQTRYARRVISRYGSAARPLLDCVWHCAEMEGEIPSGTSNTTMFPATRLYLDTSDVVDSAARMGIVRANVAYLSKRADGLGEDFFANLGANIATGLLPGGSSSRADMETVNEHRRRELNKDFVNPELSLRTQARIRGLRTRKTFMDTVLNDADLRGNSLRRLTEAFNNTLQLDPGVVRRPAMLRAGMMHFLSSPVPDIFTMSAISAAGEKSEKQRVSEVDRRKSLIEEDKKEGTDFATLVADREQDAAEHLKANTEAGEAGRARAAARRERAMERLDRGIKGMDRGIKGMGTAVRATASGVGNLAREVKAGTDRRRMIGQAVNELDKSGDLDAALSAGGFKDRKAFERELRDRASGKSVAMEMQSALDGLGKGGVEPDPVKRAMAAVRSRMDAETGDTRKADEATELFGRAVEDAVDAHRPKDVAKSTYDRTLEALARARGVDVWDLAGDVELMPVSDGAGRDRGKAILEDLASQAGSVSARVKDMEELNAGMPELNLPVDRYLDVMAALAAGETPDSRDVHEVKAGQNNLRMSSLDSIADAMVGERPAGVARHDAALSKAVIDAAEAVSAGDGVKVLSRALALNSMPVDAYADIRSAFASDYGISPEDLVARMDVDLAGDPASKSFVHLGSLAEAQAGDLLKEHPILAETF